MKPSGIQRFIVVATRGKRFSPDARHFAHCHTSRRAVEIQKAQSLHVILDDFTQPTRNFDMDLHNTPLAEIAERLAKALNVDEAVIRAIEFEPATGLRELLPSSTRVRAELRIVISERHAPDSHGRLLGSGDSPLDTRS